MPRQNIFYSNEASGLPFSEDIIIKILDLTNISLATDEDRKYNVDTWARLKAELEKRK